MTTTSPLQSRGSRNATAFRRTAPCRPATLAALNVPVETRIRQIELNLERYRWLPSDFGKRYILVNIPDYQLYAYDSGKEAPHDAGDRGRRVRQRHPGLRRLDDLRRLPARSGTCPAGSWWTR